MELDAWLAYIFDISEEEFRAGAGYGENTFRLLKVAVATIEGALKGERRRRNNGRCPRGGGSVSLPGGSAGGSEGRNGCVGDANYATARDERPILMGGAEYVFGNSG